MKLLFVGVNPLLPALLLDNGFHLTHTVIVVVLGGELFGAEFESADHLSCHLPTAGKPELVKHDLSDQLVIGNHHRHGAEKLGEVVGELGTALITGVHGDEHVEGGLHLDHLALEIHFQSVGVGV